MAMHQASAHATAVAVPVGFWRQGFVQNVLPFLTSLTLHASLLLVGFVTYKAVKVMMAPATAPGGAYIAVDSQLDQNQPRPDDIAGFKAGEAFQFKGPGDIPQLAWGRPDSDRPTAAFDERMKSLDPGGSKPGDGGMGNEMTLGTGSNPGQPKGRGMGDGNGTGNGKGDGNGDGEIPIGLGDDRGGGGKENIFVPRFYRTIYILDASGSMFSRFDDLRMELNKQIGEMNPLFTFNVIFFQAESAAALDSRQMLVATPVNKAKVKAFIDGVVPRSQTNPIPALEMAFRQSPSAIVLLTDGDFPDSPAVLKFIREHNPGGKVRIDTRAFIEEGSYQDVLKTIAHENHGQFRFVKESDLAD